MQRLGPNIALCAELAKGLAGRGHEVTLIGAGRALTPAAFLATYASRRATGSASRCRRPSTPPGPAAGELGAYYRALGSSVALVAISDAQRRAAPDLSWAATVHNAVAVERFPYRAGKDGSTSPCSPPATSGSTGTCSTRPPVLPPGGCCRSRPRPAGSVRQASYPAPRRTVHRAS